MALADILSTNGLNGRPGRVSFRVDPSSENYRCRSSKVCNKIIFQQNIMDTQKKRNKS